MSNNDKVRVFGRLYSLSERKTPQNVHLREDEVVNNNRICPWQGGGLLTISLRKLINNPNKIMMPYLSEGMSAADIGYGNYPLISCCCFGCSMKCLILSVWFGKYMKCLYQAAGCFLLNLWHMWEITVFKKACVCSMNADSLSLRSPK